MKQYILNLIVASSLFLSSLSFAHDPAKTNDPLTIYPGQVDDSFCIRYAFNGKTLMDLHEQGNPLGLPNWGAYYSALKHISTLAELHQSKINNVGSFGGGSYVYKDELCFTTIEGRTGFLTKLHEWIEASKLEPFTDTDRLTSVSQDESASNLNPALQNFQKLLEEESESVTTLPLLDPSVEEILSCADGSISDSPALNECFSTAFQLASLLQRQGQKTKSITAGDIRSRPDRFVHKGHSIISVPLDNLKPFKKQLAPAAKFQFVLGMRTLCCCGSSSTYSCGGLTLKPSGQDVALFLKNVASVLDEYNPHSLAILHGANPIESDEWRKGVDQFNKEVSHFGAEIIRDAFSEFRGISIRPSIKLKDLDEKKTK